MKQADAVRTTNSGLQCDVLHFYSALLGRRRNTFCALAKMLKIIIDDPTSDFNIA